MLFKIKVLKIKVRKCTPMYANKIKNLHFAAYVFKTLKHKICVHWRLFADKYLGGLLKIFVGMPQAQSLINTPACSWQITGTEFAI